MGSHQVVQGKNETLTGYVAVITGAGSGIGQAIALAMGAAGASVVASDLDEDRAAQTALGIRETGGKAHAQVADVSDPASVDQLIQAAVQLGGIHILVNNAGFQHVSPVEEFPVDVWNQMIAVMLTGPFLAIRSSLPVMRQQGWGRIINIASIHAKTGAPLKAAYCAAKHGVLGLTRVTALETATAGITCNAICPGFVDTPLVRNQLPDLARNWGVSVEEAMERAIFGKTPSRRMLAPAEIADLALFLASPNAAGITGQAINIDGGMVMY
jgi:3-hydroxybutyrate dehydrogenase